jgi:antitoxin HicB
MKTQILTKDVAYYMALPYVVEISPLSTADGGGYNACIPLLGRWSAVGDGDTPEAAFADLRAALPSLLAEWIERRVPIPEPAAELPSGKLSLRIPRSLHARIMRTAETEGVSINQYIQTTLALAVGDNTTVRQRLRRVHRPLARGKISR